MISKRKKLLYYLSAIIIGSFIALALFPGDTRAYYTETATVTHSVKFDGIYVEVSMTVTLYAYSYGNYAYSYSMTVTLYAYSYGNYAYSYSMGHKESKPWYAVWYAPHCYTNLYETSPGVWRACNNRKAFLFGIFWDSIIVYVQFNEDEMMFEKGHAITASSGAFVQALWDVYPDFY